MAMSVSEYADKFPSAAPHTSTLFAHIFTSKPRDRTMGYSVA